MNRTQLVDLYCSKHRNGERIVHRRFRGYLSRSKRQAREGKQNKYVNAGCENNN